jgi:hypothetical protein
MESSPSGTSIPSAQAGSELDDEFKPARAYHREIGGLFALKDAADIDATILFQPEFGSPIGP